MNQRTALLTTALTGGLLLAAGCDGTEQPARAEEPARASSAAPSPTPDVRAELVAALQRSQGVAHRYAVRGSLPEGQNVKSPRSGWS